MKNILLFAALSILMPSLSFAEDIQKKGYIEGGAGLATGNTEKSINLKGALNSYYNRFNNQISADIAREEKNNNDKTAYKLNDKLKYQISTDYYGFGEAEYNHNKLSGMNHRETGIAGIGYNLVNKEKVKLATELGVGGRETSYTGNLRDESSALAKIGENLDWEVYNNIMFNNNTYMAFTDSNTQTTSDNSLKTFVADNVYVKAGFNVENNSKVPDGIKKTDTITSLGAGYQF